MTNVMKKISAMVLALVVAFSLAIPSISAWAEPNTPAGSANITVNGATAGDSFKVWKVVEMEKDAQGNLIPYEFTSDFAAYFESKGVDIKAFQDKDSAGLADLLSGLSGWMATHAPSASPVATLTANENGSFVVSDVPAGGYFIQPDTTQSIYQPMFASIVPKVQDSAYVYDDVTFNCKKFEPGITKLVKNAASGDYAAETEASYASVYQAKGTVDYQITVTVPQYSATKSDLELTVVDTLPSGITGTGNVKVMVGGEEISATTTYTGSSESYTAFSINLASVYAEKIKGHDTVVITYSAQVNDPAALGTSGNVNNAIFTYSLYPTVASGTDTKSSSATVKTFGLEITKVDTNDETKKLANAEFDVFAGETKVGHLTTNANGVAQLAGLTSGTYSLVETKAPTGYQLDSAKKEVTVVNTTAYTPVTIKNSELGFVLPTTGATGMVIFTLAGLALMGAALLLLVKNRRKQQI